MDNGGNMILITALSADTPNLDAFMQEYGLVKADGNIADTRQAYMGNPYYLIPTISKNDVTSNLSSDAAVLLFNAGGAVEADSVSENVTVTPFLTTSSSGYAVTEDNQVQGTYILGAVCEKSAEDGTTSRLTVFTTNTIINEQLISQYTNISNADVFINSVTANFEDVQNVSVDPVSLDVTYNTVSNQSFWGIWLVIIIPLVVLIYGFIRWIMRRKL
jgi:ABC-2 type transport system permease protein